MGLKLATLAVGLAMLGALSRPAGAIQADGQPQGPAAPPGLMEQLKRMRAAYDALPDGHGTGAYPSIKEQDGFLPDHVIYRPADLSKIVGKLGVVAWGNGGCSSDGAGERLHLLQLASHGYLVIANGAIKSGPGAPPQPPPAPRGAGLPPAETRPEQLTEAIDWALRENSRPGSPYYGKIDPAAVAVSGWSCGGLQAIQIAASDARVKAVVIHNSGVFANPPAFMKLEVNKQTLDRLHTPIIYILGGPSDIAYANGMDDFAHITRTPAFVANLGDVGHGGTFYQPDGGPAALVAVHWLDWQLKGDPKAGEWFVGPDCKLCRDPRWKVMSKGF